MARDEQEKSFSKRGLNLKRVKEEPMFTDSEDELEDQKVEICIEDSEDEDKDDNIEHNQLCFKCGNSMVELLSRHPEAAMECTTCPHIYHLKCLPPWVHELFDQNMTFDKINFMCSICH